jgi:hypothetical protein
LAIIACLLSAILFLQSVKFASNLWVILEFGYGEWGKYLLSMLDSLKIWAILAGIIFSIQFFVDAPANDLKKILLGKAAGFITGFIFTYFLVLIIGIIIYIPLGIISIFMPEIIIFATLQFAWLVATYIIFMFIAIDTPQMLFYVIKQGNWYIKLLGVLMTVLLGVQSLKAITGGLLIIMKNSIWQTNTSLVAIGISIIITIVINIIFFKRESISKVVFTIVIVYIASIITGNVSYGVFHWGEFPSLALASFIGPLLYTSVAKTIIIYGINAISGILGFIGGFVIGIFIDQYTKLRIIGQGWFGIFCGTMITIGFGIGFGLIWGPSISHLLLTKAKINPLTSFCLGAGSFLGIIVGMVSGGFLAR